MIYGATSECATCGTLKILSSPAALAKQAADGIRWLLYLPGTESFPMRDHLSKYSK